MADLEGRGEADKGSVSETGIKVVAGVGGGIMGALIAGPAGAVIGSVVGNAAVPVLEYLGLQFRVMLGERENRRVVRVLEEAQATIRRNISLNKPLRQDGFLGAESTDHSAAEEICEAVIRKAQEEYEERKVRYQGILLGNLPFTPDIDRAQANLLVRLAFHLSYRQLCLLSVFCQPDEFEVTHTFVTPNPYIFADSLSKPEYDEAVRLRKEERERILALLSTAHDSVRQESYDLYTMGLIYQKDDGRRDSVAIISQFLYGEVAVRRLGKTLFSMMDLREIDRADLDRVAALMRDDVTYYG